MAKWYHLRGEGVIAIEGDLIVTAPLSLNLFNGKRISVLLEWADECSPVHMQDIIEQELRRPIHNDPSSSNRKP